MKIKSLGISIVVATALSIGFIGCGSSSSDTPTTTDPSTLTKKWETDANLSVPESVIYDSNKQVIYASDVNSTASNNPWIDNDGYISKIDENGTILSLKWVTGLKAPKGLTVNGEHLYVADLNTVVEINTTNGAILNTFNAPAGTDNLNDISYDINQSVLYLSDSNNKQVWKMTTTGVFTLVYDAQNGVYVDGRKLIMQDQKGNLKSMNLDTNAITIISSSIDNISIDGIWNYKDKGYLVSDWNGKIYFINNNGTSKLLLTTDPIRSADISYSPELGLLLIPDFDKKIIAYEVE